MEKTMYDRIKELRKNRRMSQEELATLVGYSSRSTIARVEAGEIDISQSKIQAFADALGTSPNYLLGTTDDPRPAHSRKNETGFDKGNILEQLNLTDQQIKILKMYVELQENDQESINRMVTGLHMVMERTK